MPPFYQYTPGAPPSSASPEARHPPPHTGGLCAGVPSLPAVCGGSQPDGDGGVPVWRALPGVPYRARVSHRESRQTGRPRRAARHRRTEDRLPALADALLRRHPPTSPPGLWLVPHARELGHTRRAAPGPPWHRGIGGTRAPLAPRERLGVATGAAGGQRGGPTTAGASGPPAGASRPRARPCGPGVCGGPRSAPVAAGRGSLDAARDPGSGQDARQTCAALSGGSAASPPRHRAPWPRPAHTPRVLARPPDPAGPDVPTARGHASRCRGGSRR